MDIEFKAPTEEGVSIALTSGHTAFVSYDGTAIDKKFHREAIALGCYPSTMDKPEDLKSHDFNRAEAIGSAMEAMIKNADASDFTGNGSPDLRKLTARVGFKVAREEADSIWAEVSKG